MAHTQNVIDKLKYRLITDSKIEGGKSRFDIFLEYDRQASVTASNIKGHFHPHSTIYNHIFVFINAYTIIVKCFVYKVHNHMFTQSSQKRIFMPNVYANKVLLFHFIIKMRKRKENNIKELLPLSLGYKSALNCQVIFEKLVRVDIL